MRRDIHRAIAFTTRDGAIGPRAIRPISQAGAMAAEAAGESWRCIATALSRLAIAIGGARKPISKIACGAGAGNRIAGVTTAIETTRAGIHRRVGSRWAGSAARCSRGAEGARSAAITGQTARRIRAGRAIDTSVVRHLLPGGASVGAGAAIHGRAAVVRLGSAFARTGRFRRFCLARAQTVEAAQRAATNLPGRATFAGCITPVAGVAADLFGRAVTVAASIVTAGGHTIRTAIGPAFAGTRRASAVPPPPLLVARTSPRTLGWDAGSAGRVDLPAKQRSRGRGQTSAQHPAHECAARSRSAQPPDQIIECFSVHTFVGPRGHP